VASRSEMNNFRANLGEQTKKLFAPIRKSKKLNKIIEIGVFLNLPYV
jgi:hypothetical protein